MNLPFKLGERRFGCPVELTMSAIGGKWKLLILWNLTGGVLRYGELRRVLPGVTHKMLTQQLRELEADGLVEREVFPVVPPHVEYRLSSSGRALVPVLDSMRDWGLGHLDPAMKGKAKPVRKV